MKEKKVKPTRNPCLCCPSNTETLHMDTVLHEGYCITKGGETHYTADFNTEWDDCKKLSEIEKDALKEPDAEWQAHLNMALRSGAWQRHGKGEWCLIESGIGYA